MQSYTSSNEYFVIDIGRNLGKSTSIHPMEENKLKKDIFKQLEAFSQKPEKLRISIDYFEPICHQDRLREAMEKCGEFNLLSQMPGARKRSSSHQIQSDKREGQIQNTCLEQIEMETYYPGLMLEQRLTGPTCVHFREVGDDWAE